MTLQNKKLKIIIADDHPLFRAGIETALKSMAIAAKISHASDGEEVLRILEREPHDLVLMDIKMKPMDGITATEIICDIYPKTKVLALSFFEDEKNILAMLEKGASGYLIKNAEKQEIKQAINDVMEGKRYLSQGASNILYEHLNKINNTESVVDTDGAFQKERFREVAFLLCYEFTTPEIAETLFVADKTVEYYRTQLFRKTGSKNVAGLCKIAISNKVNDDPKLKAKFEKALKKKREQ